MIFKYNDTWALKVDLCTSHDKNIFKHILHFWDEILVTIIQDNDSTLAVQIITQLYTLYMMFLPSKMLDSSKEFRKERSLIIFQRYFKAFNITHYK